MDKEELEEIKEILERIKNLLDQIEKTNQDDDYYKYKNIFM